MKHQFKFNPLATAILTLLCGTSLTSHAATSADAHSKTTSLPNELYPGQNFFEQYYVDKDQLSSQQEQQLGFNSAYCQGGWLTPAHNIQNDQNLNTGDAKISADYGYYNPQGDSYLEGNVLIEQDGRQVRANQVTIDQTQTLAQASGNVQLAQDGIFAQSDQIDYNLNTRQGDLNESFYIAEKQHAHGYAKQIAKTSPTQLTLEQATYTTCPPEQKPGWKLEANHIELDEETGRGITTGTTLYVKDVPVLSVPYFNFPIDDRRTTGILTPSFGYTNDGGFEVALPVYLNLAPHYDATLTPRFLSDRGAMLEAEFRYLTPEYGQGRIWGGFLGSDSSYDHQDRKDLHIEHQWQINSQLSTNVDFNYASDKDYFTDLNNDPNVRTDLNLRRAWELNYANGIPGLTAQLKIEDFQTLDPNVSYKDRPYARLPQFLLNYKAGDVQGLEFEFNHDTAYFKKTADFDYNRINHESHEPSGVRLYNDFKVRYNYRNPWGFFIPEVAVRNLNTYFDQETQDTLGNSSHNRTLLVPQFSLDTGVTFEKEGKYLHSITPRLFYAYAPYKNQQNQPNFDSTTASVNYDQLFSPYRFYGNDRLEDNNFASLGLSYSLFDDIGLERLKASIGQSFYFQDRRVTLESQADIFDREDHTGPIVQISSQISNHITLSANGAWMSNGDNAQRDVQVNYATDKGNLYNFGYFSRKEIPNRQRQYDQVMASFIQPMHNNWRLIGHAQYDIDNSVARELLLGINYEACCWGLSVYGRSYYNDLDDLQNPDVKPKRAVMAEVNLKGLGGFTNRFSSLLENRILGFNNINQSWTQR